MVWDISWIPVDGTAPDDGDFNLFLTGNPHDLKGDTPGQTVTDRAATVFAAGFETTEGLTHTYTVDGSAFRLIYESASPAIGAKMRLVFAAADPDDPDATEVRLGYIEARKTGTDSGELSFGAYQDNGSGGQMIPSAPALRIMPDGKGAFGKAAAAYDYDALGPVRAAAFEQGGSGVGQWVEVGGDKTFDGDARVTGQLIQGPANNEFETATPMFDFESRTLIADSNVGLLLGNAWQSGTTQIAQSVGNRPVPATFTWSPIVDLVLERAGTHILLFAGSIVNVDPDSSGFWSKVPGSELSADLPFTLTGSGTANETLPTYALSVYTATAAGETVTAQVLNGTYVDTVATGQLMALWCSPGLIVFLRSIQPTWQMGQLGTIIVT